MDWLLVSFLARQQASSFLIGSHTLTSPLGNHLGSGVLGMAPLLIDSYKATFIGFKRSCCTLLPTHHAPLGLEMHKKVVYSAYTSEQMFDSLLGHFNSVPSLVIKSQL